jgi:hypothetical protein
MSLPFKRGNLSEAHSQIASANYCLTHSKNCESLSAALLNNCWWRASRGKHLVLKQVRGGHFLIKPNTWLLITVVVCSWVTTSQRICARSEMGVHPNGLPYACHFFHSHKWFTPGLNPARFVHCPPSSLVNSHATGPTSARHSRWAELPLDNEEPAEDSRSDAQAMEFADGPTCPRAAEWRLSRPDPQCANSFINSKAKPPPREHNHEKHQRIQPFILLPSSPSAIQHSFRPTTTIRPGHGFHPRRPLERRRESCRWELCFSGSNSNDLRTRQLETDKNLTKIQGRTTP